jgi:hypothetical protein
MLYKFRSKAAGDVIMLGPTGDAVLRAAGREPAPQGIFEPAALAAARSAIERAITEDDAARAEAEAKARAEGVKLPKGDGLGLRQRAWPLVEMMKRAQVAGEAIVWGV